jgi:hypothetical protein
MHNALFYSGYWAFVPLFALVVLHDAKRMLIDDLDRTS